MNNKVSVIVPVYNVEKYIKTCIESIMSQTYSNIEIILVDDGSTDESGNICDEYAKNDSRINVIHKANGGLSDARNAGMSVSTGEYIIFIDSDDSIKTDDCIEKINAALSDDKVDILFTKKWKGEKEVASGTEVLDYIFAKDTFVNFSIVVWDKVYRRQFIIDNNLTFESGYVHEDNLWTLQNIFLAKKCKCCECDFYNHNIVEQSITRAPSEKGKYNRVVGKLHIAMKGIKFFSEYKNDRIVKEVVKSYIGMYISGVVHSKEIKDDELSKKAKEKIKETQHILAYGKYTNRIDYVLLSIVYTIFKGMAIDIIKLKKNKIRKEKK